MSARELGEAFRSGRSTPSRHLQEVLGRWEAQERRVPPARALREVMRERATKDARASDERWRAGRALGPLDGMPVVVKDGLDVEGAPTRCGTRYLPSTPAKRDSAAVARLRAAGAIVLAKAAMHEHGAGPTGYNPHDGTPRNPRDTRRICGGSSSGSAAAVASNLAVVALGTDAGGSIRIPSALCGVVGLKPTYGRVSRRGFHLLAWSMDHVGPIASTVTDVALALDCIAGEDPEDHDTHGQPPCDACSSLEQGIDGLRIGVVDQARIAQGLAALRAAGARLETVTLPDEDVVRSAGVTILGCEAASALEEDMREHASELGPDVRLMIAGASQLRALDYLRAQRVRTLLLRQMDELFARYDAVVLPTTECAAPFIRPGDEEHGVVDPSLVDALTRYTMLACLTGHPACSVPSGAEDGMPLGMQVIGRPWDEATVLRVARTVERARGDKPW